MPKRKHSVKIEHYHRKIRRLEEKQQRGRQRIVESDTPDTDRDLDNESVLQIEETNSQTACEEDPTNRVETDQQLVVAPELNPDILAALGDTTTTQWSIWELRNPLVASYDTHRRGGAKAVSRKVIEKRVHKNFDELHILHDIAILKVDKDFPLNANIKRVIIPLVQYPKPTSGSVTGWGISDETTGENSNVLKVVKQKVRDRKACLIIGRLHPGMFCAGSTAANDAYTSYGDSGNAFIVSNYRQIGVASFSVKDAPALMVYTNVTYYYKWIEKYSRDIFCKEDSY